MVDQNHNNDPLTLDDTWISRINRREKFLEDTTNENNWERYVEEYKGNFTRIFKGDTKLLPLNLIYSFVRAKTPDLYLQDPYFEFTPKKQTTVGAAKLKEIAVNDIWHRKKFKREVKKDVQDALVIGHGWAKVGYNANIGNLEELDTTEFNSDAEDYFLYRVNWRHIIFNDESVDAPWDSTWMGQKFFVPLDDAKKQYGAKASKLTGIKLSSEQRKDEAGTNKTNKSKFVGDVFYAELYEIWDKTNKQVLIISKQKNVGVLHKRDWPYTKMQGFPFLMLNLSEVNDDPYGISDVGMGEPIVFEKTKIRTSWLEHLKRGNRQLMTPGDNFSEESKEAYKRGDDSALLEVEHPELVKPLPYAAFQSDVFGLESRLDDDLSQIWGQRGIDRAGTARTQTRTKFELQKQGVGSTNRLLEQQNTVQDFTEEAAEKLSSLLEQYATEPFYVQITGFDPQVIAEMLAKRPSALQPNAITTSFGFTLTNEDIKGPVDVKIKRGSAVPLDKQSKLEVLERMADIYSKFQTLPPGPFIGAIAKEYVEEIGLHPLVAALQQEGEFRRAQSENQQKQTEAQQQLAAGQDASKLQLEVEKLSAKKDEVQGDQNLELLNIIKDIQIQVAALTAKQGEKTNG